MSPQPDLPVFSESLDFDVSNDKIIIDNNNNTITTSTTSTSTSTTSIITTSIITTNIINNNERVITGYMKHALDHMVVICDLCLQSTYKFGSHLPLPIRRPDLLGLMWMCKRCRDWYEIIHPEVMNDSARVFQDSDVYEFIPADVDTDDDDDDDIQDGRRIVIPAQKTKADPNSWLNKVLSRGRKRLLKSMLGIYELEFLEDSHLCRGFVSGGLYDPRKIVMAMREMKWFKKTRYQEYRSESVGSERAKAMAITFWAQWPRENANTIKVVNDDPPDSLWPKVEFALKQSQLCKDQRKLRLNGQGHEASMEQEEYDDVEMDEEEDEEDEDEEVMRVVSVALGRTFSFKVDCTIKPEE
ncbi:hypothetical protein BGZ65_000637 [Modicella reniformis]|uniref:Uncharacterized protein n=1 Tax=Modicella reniformis TaxID=1440133 RepID=A0A9P6LTM3_9FUNG|nr:hypothetical protein BGZ65_000637 [Modicella reniformis]